MNVRIVKSETSDKKDRLVIELELQTPTASASGKNLVIASTHGIVATTAKVDGKVVKLGVNAFIAR